MSPRPTAPVLIELAGPPGSASDAARLLADVEGVDVDHSYPAVPMGSGGDASHIVRARLAAGVEEAVRRHDGVIAVWHDAPVEPF